MERRSAYLGAQKIWERINKRDAPNKRIFYQVPDGRIEIAMGGQNHVLMGLTKVSRYAHRQWGAIMHKAGQGADGQSIAKLYEEFENALKDCKKEKPELDIDEMHR